MVLNLYLKAHMKCGVKSGAQKAFASSFFGEARVATRSDSTTHNFAIGAHSPRGIFCITFCRVLSKQPNTPTLFRSIVDLLFMLHANSRLAWRPTRTTREPRTPTALEESAASRSM